MELNVVLTEFLARQLVISSGTKSFVKQCFDFVITVLGNKLRKQQSTFVAALGG